MIERRANTRLPVSLDVVLSHREQSVIGTLRDIGLGGAFLEVDPDLLPYGGVVELKLSLASDSLQNHMDLSATIERTTRNGAGVSFRDMRHEAYFRLVELMIAAGRDPSSSVDQPRPLSPAPDVLPAAGRTR